MILLAVLKTIGGPGSIGFLLVASVIGLVLIRLGRVQRLGRVWLFSLYASYLLMSLPIFAQMIADPLGAPVIDRGSVSGRIDTLIVLDGDNRRGRAAEAGKLWAASHPATVVFSGEPWLIGLLLQHGIPRARLVYERDSRTTREQVEYIRQFTTAHRSTHIAVVASRLQMPRVAALVRRAGVTADLYPAPVDREPARNGLRRFVPAYAALRVSRDALYERVALHYYRWRGWIAPTPPAQLASTS